MNIIVKPAFDRDVARVKDYLLLKALYSKLDQLERARTTQNITGIKKLDGYTTHYRIYVTTKSKSYRIGAILRGSTLWLVRFLPRKVIYRNFP